MTVPENGDAGALERLGRPDHADAKYALPAALHVIDRPRLYDRLDAGAESPITLLSASAGWGKTLLLSSWLSARVASAAPSAWLTVGPPEDDPGAFWRAVTTALADVVDEPTAVLLRRAADDGGPVTGVAGRVIDALAHATPATVLVLDNLHEISSPEVHASLVQIADSPAAGLRLIVSTRRDPPWPSHRLRLAGLVHEVGAAELAFAPDEARGMFGEVGVELTGPQLDLLLQRTDGWAAALRLAALHLRLPGADIAGYVRNFSGDERTVSAYVLGEVLEPQAASAQQFLRSIGILDYVCAELADAVTGGQDGAAMLAELSSANLFVHSVGDGGRWHRLPGLVSDVLRSQMADPRVRRDQHRRAAEWYRRHSLPEPAIRLALRGGLLPLAAELVGIHVLGLVLRGRGRELDTMLSSVPRGEMLGHAELAAGLVGARMVYGHQEELPELIIAAEARIGELPDVRARRVRMVLDLVGIAEARVRGDLDGVAAVCRRITHDPVELAGLGMSGWDLIRILILSNRGTAELWLGELDAAGIHLRAAFEAEPEQGVLLPHLNAQAHLALLACERGELTSAHAQAEAVIARAAAAGAAATAQVVPAYLALTWIHLDRDEAGEAEHWLGRVDGVEAVAPERHVQLAAAVLLARYRAEDDPEGALDGLETSTRALAGAPLPAASLDRSLVVRAELTGRLGGTERVRALLAGLHSHVSPEAVTAAAGLHLLEDRPDAAEKVLAALDPDLTTVRTEVTSQVLRALSAAARDEVTPALRFLDRALRLAAPHRLRRPFIDRAAGLRGLLARRVERGTVSAAFAVDLLERMSPGPSPPPQSLHPPPDPLTARETVILRYLSSTLTNSETAAALSVSVNTVKSHQHSVYRKLGVTGRRDAVRRARELWLL
jgi:LuxR family transcriptional regulator, maltose regulon positive regulatory protein